MNPQPNRFFQLSLVFLVALNLLPHFLDYTVPTLAVGGLCLSWRLLYEYQVVPLPNFLTKLGLVASLFYLVYENYGQILGLESGSALLICAVSLKLIDRVGYRDAMVLLFLNFMLLLARFFESQSLGITVFAGFDLIITTALLVQLHNGSQMKFDLKSLLKTGLKLFAQIAPVMVLLFFVFPRFSTGFLQARTKTTQLNGFSDSMEPGSMAKLAQTDQMAFRVKFRGSPPTSFDMYWRGGVLISNEQMKWHKGRAKLSDIFDSRARSGEYVVQEILLEPIFNEWIFTMEKPLWVENRNQAQQKRMKYWSDNVFRFTKPIEKKIFYVAYSNQSYQEELGENRDEYLQSPSVNDARVLSLVKEISQEAKNNEQIAGRLMKFYQKQFRYTLEPGKLQSNELGEFLFDKKVGFCEHFATSFAALMRLAGVPARVVVGFQGGRKNELSDYYMVTSKDAHAWTEIWSEEKRQWLRFDPTIMVAPLRLDLGGDLYHSLSEEERLRAQGNEQFLANYRGGWMGQAFLAVDALATNWNLFLLNYDRSAQQDFFQSLGFKKVNQSVLTLVSLLILLLFFLWIRLKGSRNRRKDSPAQKAYLSLRERLEKVGIEKEAAEGPSDFLVRVAQRIPEERDSVESFRMAYLENYYGEIPSQQNFQQMQAKIKIR